MNKLLKQTMIGLALLLVLAPAAQGQRLRASASEAKAKEPVDEIEQLLDRYILAQGGLALFKVSSRIMRGRVEMSGSPIPGSFESYEKSPDKSMMVVNAPGGQFLAANDGHRRWLQTPWGSTWLGAAAGDIKLLEQARSGGSFKWRNAFTTARLKGTALVEGHQTIVLAATPRGGEPLVIYFDAETSLPRKVERMRPAPDEGDDFLKAAYFDGWATVDGVKVPALIRQVYTKFTITFRATEVRHNVSISDTLFESPKGK